MANYNVTTTNYGPAAHNVVTLAMDTYIKTIDATKTIYLYAVEPHSCGELYTGTIVHAT